eukprot:4551644-Amphidinium_carterae.1
MNFDVCAHELGLLASLFIFLAFVSGRCRSRREIQIKSTQSLNNSIYFCNNLKIGCTTQVRNDTRKTSGKRLAASRQEWLGHVPCEKAAGIQLRAPRGEASGGNRQL